MPCGVPTAHKKIVEKPHPRMDKFSTTVNPPTVGDKTEPLRDWRESSVLLHKLLMIRANAKYWSLCRNSGRKFFFSEHHAHSLTIGA